MHVTVSLFDNAKTSIAARTTIDFDELLADFREPYTSDLEPSADNARVLKLSAPAFAPALFREDRRKKANIELAQVLAFDIDEQIDPAQLSARLRRRGISYCVHSTTSGKGVHVFDTVLARPVDAETYLQWYWDEAPRLVLWDRGRHVEWLAGRSHCSSRRASSRLDAGTITLIA